MPGPKVPVVVTGNELPREGRRWSGYRTAVRELALGRNANDRHRDRQELKAGKTLTINGYTIRHSA